MQGKGYLSVCVFKMGETQCYLDWNSIVEWNMLPYVN